MTGPLPEPAPCAPPCPPVSPALGPRPLTDVEVTQAYTGPLSLHTSADGANVGIPSEAPQPAIERAVLDPAEMGQLLGVSTSKVYDLHGRAELPAPVRVGSRGLRWAKAEVEAWLLHSTPPRGTWERTWPRIRKEVLRR